MPTPSGNNALDEDDRLALDGVAPSNKLQKEDLVKLQNSAQLKHLLTNTHLRDYLSYINSLDFPRGFIRLAMQEPIFVEFADACLKAIHPEDNEPKEVTDEEVIKRLQEKLDERTDENVGM